MILVTPFIRTQSPSVKRLTASDQISCNRDELFNLPSSCEQSLTPLLLQSCIFGARRRYFESVPAVSLINGSFACLDQEDDKDLTMHISITEVESGVPGGLRINRTRKGKEQQYPI